jgi:hypothetical protein
VRRPAHLAPLVALRFCVSACSAIAGLDGITESACAPTCGEDEGGAGDASVAEAGTLDRTDGSIDAGDARREAAPGLPDAGDEVDAMRDQAAPDAPWPETGAFEASIPDAPVESAVPDATDAGPCGAVFFRDAFDSDAQGWTLDTSWSIASTCANPPAPKKGNADPTVDHTTGAAGGVAGAYVCGNNPTGATAPARYATSPVVDVASAPTVHLTFYRWLNTDALSYMVSTVDVYDGAAWVNLYTNPTGTGNAVTDGTWTRESYDVTAYRNAHFQVRFGYAIVSAGVYEMSCWNVDDLTISTAACP